MNRVTSADGTSIAYDVTGSGPPVVLVGGSFQDRTGLVPLGRLLAERMTVIQYDRRGRGGSGDQGHTVEREVADLAAVAAAGEEAARAGSPGPGCSVFGYSAGAALVLQAAVGGVPFHRLAIYEPPYTPPGEPKPLDALAAEIERLVRSGDRSAAVDLFLAEALLLPRAGVRQMRRVPFRAHWESLAHTLPYDIAVVGPSQPPDGLASVDVPALVISCGRSFPRSDEVGAGLADALRGRHVHLPSQTHDFQPSVVAPLLLEHFLAD